MADQSVETTVPVAEAEPPATVARPGRIFMRQKPMRRVVWALVPLLIAGIYFFGWRVLAVLAVCNLAGVLTEYITSRRRGQPISQACFVTCWLYSLSLPPTVPLWIAVVGIVFAILFAKEVFGGFGRNFANPAITGRAFVYVCFPVSLTAQFVPVFGGFPGGFSHWSFASLNQLPGYLAGSGREVADAISQASPMWVYRDLGQSVWAQSCSYMDMFTGNIGGMFATDGAARIMSAGSIGEACVPLILIAAVYLLWTKTANWRLMLSCLVGLSVASGIFRNLLGFDGLGEIPPLMFNLFAGTTLYVLVFMVTCPVTAPSRKLAIYAYGFIVGFFIVVFRWRGVFVAAASFSLLLGNILAPLLDMGAKAWTDWRKAVAKTPKEAI